MSVRGVVYSGDNTKPINIGNLPVNNSRYAFSADIWSQDQYSYSVHATIQLDGSNRVFICQTTNSSPTDNSWVEVTSSSSVGDVSKLYTNNKSSVVNAINEVVTTTKEHVIVNVVGDWLFPDGYNVTVFDYSANKIIHSLQVASTPLTLNIYLTDGKKYGVQLAHGSTPITDEIIFTSVGDTIRELELNTNRTSKTISGKDYLYATKEYAEKLASKPLYKHVLIINDKKPSSNYMFVVYNETTSESEQINVTDYTSDNVVYLADSMKYNVTIYVNDVPVGVTDFHIAAGGMEGNTIWDNVGAIVNGRYPSPISLSQNDVVKTPSEGKFDSKVPSIKYFEENLTNSDSRCLVDLKLSKSFISAAEKAFSIIEVSTGKHIGEDFYAETPADIHNTWKTKESTTCKLEFKNDGVQAALSEEFTLTPYSSFDFTFNVDALEFKMDTSVDSGLISKSEMYHLLKVKLDESIPQDAYTIQIMNRNGDVKFNSSIEHTFKAFYLTPNENYTFHILNRDIQLYEEPLFVAGIGDIYEFNYVNSENKVLKIKHGDTLTKDDFWFVGDAIEDSREKVMEATSAINLIADVDTRAYTTITITEYPIAANTINYLCRLVILDEHNKIIDSTNIIKGDLTTYTHQFMLLPFTKYKCGVTVADKYEYSEPNFHIANIHTASTITFDGNGKIVSSDFSDSKIATQDDINKIQHHLTCNFIDAPASNSGYKYKLLVDGVFVKEQVITEANEPLDYYISYGKSFAVQLTKNDVFFLQSKTMTAIGTSNEVHFDEGAKEFNGDIDQGVYAKLVDIGDLKQLQQNDKSSLVNAINSMMCTFHRVGFAIKDSIKIPAGKSLIASVYTDNIGKAFECTEFIHVGTDLTCNIYIPAGQDFKCYLKFSGESVAFGETSTMKFSQSDSSRDLAFDENGKITSDTSGFDGKYGFADAKELGDIKDIDIQASPNVVTAVENLAMMQQLISISVENAKYPFTIKVNTQGNGNQEVIAKNDKTVYAYAGSGDSYSLEFGGITTNTYIGCGGTTHRFRYDDIKKEIIEDDKDVSNLAFASTVGELSSLQQSNKSSIVSAINEVNILGKVEIELTTLPADYKTKQYALTLLDEANAVVSTFNIAKTDKPIKKHAFYVEPEFRYMCGISIDGSLWTSEAVVHQMPSKGYGLTQFDAAGKVVGSNHRESIVLTSKDLRVMRGYDIREVYPTIFEVNRKYDTTEAFIRDFYGEISGTEKFYYNAKFINITVINDGSGTPLQIKDLPAISEDMKSFARGLTIEFFTIDGEQYSLLKLIDALNNSWTYLCYFADSTPGVWKPSAGGSSNIFDELTIGKVGELNSYKTSVVGDKLTLSSIADVNTKDYMPFASATRAGIDLSGGRISKEGDVFVNVKKETAAFGNFGKDLWLWGKNKEIQFHNVEEVDATLDINKLNPDELGFHESNRFNFKISPEKDIYLKEINGFEFKEMETYPNVLFRVGILSANKEVLYETHTRAQWENGEGFPLTTNKITLPNAINVRATGSIEVVFIFRKPVSVKGIIRDTELIPEFRLLIDTVERDYVLTDKSVYPRKNIIIGSNASSIKVPQTFKNPLNEEIVVTDYSNILSAFVYPDSSTSATIGSDSANTRFYYAPNVIKIEESANHLNDCAQNEMIGRSFSMDVDIPRSSGEYYILKTITLKLKSESAINVIINGQALYTDEEFIKARTYSKDSEINLANRFTTPFFESKLSITLVARDGDAFIGDAFPWFDLRYDTASDDVLISSSGFMNNLALKQDKITFPANPSLYLNGNGVFTTPTYPLITNDMFTPKNKISLMGTTSIGSKPQDLTPAEVIAMLPSATPTEGANPGTNGVMTKELATALYNLINQSTAQITETGDFGATYNTKSKIINGWTKNTTTFGIEAGKTTFVTLAYKRPMQEVWNIQGTLVGTPAGYENLVVSLDSSTSTSSIVFKVFNKGTSIVTGMNLYCTYIGKIQ